MQKILLTVLVSSLSLAGASSLTNTTPLGEGYHIITSASGLCTSGQDCTIPYGDKLCDADTLGTVYRRATNVGNGTYTYEDQTCVWGDASRYVIDTYTVKMGGEDFSCPIVASGPFLSTTNVWPPRRFEGLTPIEYVYCDQSRESLK